MMAVKQSIIVDVIVTGYCRRGRYRAAVAVYRCSDRQADPAGSARVADGTGRMRTLLVMNVHCGLVHLLSGFLLLSTLRASVLEPHLQPHIKNSNLKIRDFLKKCCYYIIYASELYFYS